MGDQTSVNPGVPEPLEPGPSGAGFISGFVGTARAVLLSPRSFFPGMPVEGGLLGPYFFFLLCTLCFFVGFFGLNLLATRSFDPRILSMMLLALGMPFVSAGLLYFYLSKLLGTGGSYEATFRVVCYASAVNLGGWVPILGIFLQFYEIYLSALGLSIVHRTTVGRALLAVVATALTVFLLAALAVRGAPGS